MLFVAAKNVFAVEDVVNLEGIVAIADIVAVENSDILEDIDVVGDVIAVGDVVAVGSVVASLDEKGNASLSTKLSALRRPSKEDALAILGVPQNQARGSGN